MQPERRPTKNLQSEVGYVNWDRVCRHRRRVSMAVQGFREMFMAEFS